MKKKILTSLFLIMVFAGVTACGSNGNAGVVSENENKEDVVSDKEGESQSEGTMLFDVPSGFTYDSEDEMYHSDIEDEMANIIYYTVENDGSFSTVTKDVMKEALQQSFGSELTIEMTKWETLSVSGFDAIHYQISYAYMGIEVVQDQLIVNGTDDFHYLTFTHAGDEDYEDVYNDCIKSARFE